MQCCLLLLLPVDKFQSVSEATGYPAAWFFVVACLVMTGVLTLVGGAKLLVDLLGFVYPAYMSFKSMDTNAGDDTQWLTYWIVFSFLSIVETMLSFLTALIPMYFWLKVAIIIVRILLYSIVCIAVVVVLRMGSINAGGSLSLSLFSSSFSNDPPPPHFWCDTLLHFLFVVIAVDVVSIHPRSPNHLRSNITTHFDTLH